MKKKILNGLLLVFVGYLVLVALRFILLELGGPSRREAAFYEQSIAIQMPALASVSSVRNYATAKYAQVAAPVQTEQKYEKIASLTSSTSQFEADERKARDSVRLHSGLIQEEQSVSTDRRRSLLLTIGVPPDNFDAAVIALKTIGENAGFEVTKTDKTNEYLGLRAKRTSLEKTRDALMGLKGQGGKIEELIKLEQEILNLEEKIQALGVQLGQFDKENEFCTVRFALTEKIPHQGQPVHFGYLLDAMAWASTVYLALLGCTFVGLLCVLLVLGIVEKARLFQPPPR
jgi:hypothetical protein